MKKRLLSITFATALLAVTAGQAMAQTNGLQTSGSVDLTNSVFTNASVTPFDTSDTGGGVWDYGTSLSGLTKKKVWSNYNHPKKTHSSSCSIGTTSSHSGPTMQGTTAYSSAVGGLTADTHAYWSAQ
jgi:lactococcin 972 family bacteriocin